MAANLQSVAAYEAGLADRERLVRQALEALIERFGREIYEEPSRCEAMLRDLCPDCRREVFLVVAALREQVVGDLVQHAGKTPDDVLMARNSRRLQDGLGLSEKSARWAVESWLSSAQVLAALPPRPLPIPRVVLEAAVEAEPEFDRRLPSWLWTALTFTAIVCSFLAAAAIAYTSLYHGWQSLRDWFREAAIFVAALGLCVAGLWQAGRALAKAPPPRRLSASGRRMYRCMPEVLVLLLLPLVPAGGITLWATEWAFAFHTAGRVHDLAFHLGRMLESLLLLIFVWQWIRATIVVQARVAALITRDR
jgi:hypothetical protein